MQKLGAFVLGALLALVSVSDAATQGGYPSRPRFQSVTSVANDITTGPTAAYVATSAAPHFVLNETDAAADSRLWRIRVNASNFDIQTLDDAITTAKNVFGAGRSGNVVTGVNFGNATDNPSYSFLGTGALSFNNASVANFINPASDAAVDLGSTALRFRTISATGLRDGTNGQFVGSSGATAQIASGTTWTAVQIGNATGNPTYSFLGTGAVALTANSTVGGSLVCRADGTNCPLTESSGNFTASFDDACSTTPTITFGYVKTGTTVTLSIKSQSGWSCTSDSTNTATTGTPVPAAIRPTHASGQPFGQIAGGCLNSSASALCSFAISSTGNVVVQRLDSGGGITTWTNSGLKAVPPNGAMVLTYYTGNP